MAGSAPLYFDSDLPFLPPTFSGREGISLDGPSGSTPAFSYPVGGLSSWPEIPGVDSSLTGAPPPQTRARFHPKNTITAPCTKKVRNRNTVSIECEPCNRIFTRICVYRAHVKTRKHAFNLTLFNSGASFEQVTPAPASYRPSQGPPPVSTRSGLYMSTPSTESEDTIDFDFSNFNWGVSSDYLTFTSESQTSAITPPAPWMALPPAPVEATLTITGTPGHIIKGFYHPSANLFIPTGVVSADYHAHLQNVPI